VLTEEDEMRTAITYHTGQILELHTPAHPYVDEQLGWTDTKHIIPAKTERFRVARVCRRGDDFRLTLRDAGAGYGCGILVSRWLSWRNWGRTIKVIE
jgi:hypothetical protein